MANCKSCGAQAVMWDFCLSCIKQILQEWETRQSQPLDVEVVEQPVRVLSYEAVE